MLHIFTLIILTIIFNLFMNYEVQNSNIIKTTKFYDKIKDLEATFELATICLIANLLPSLGINGVDMSWHSMMKE